MRSPNKLMPHHSQSIALTPVDSTPKRHPTDPCKMALAFGERWDGWRPSLYTCARQICFAGLHSAVNLTLSRWHKQMIQLPSEHPHGIYQGAVNSGATRACFWAFTIFFVQGWRRFKVLFSALPKPVQSILLPFLRARTHKRLYQLVSGSCKQFFHLYS